MTANSDNGLPCVRGGPLHILAGLSGAGSVPPVPASINIIVALNIRGSARGNASPETNLRPQGSTIVPSIWEGALMGLFQTRQCEEPVHDGSRGVSVIFAG